MAQNSLREKQILRRPEPGPKGEKESPEDQSSIRRMTGSASARSPGSNMNICVPKIYYSLQLGVCNAPLLAARCPPIIDYVNSPTGSSPAALPKALRFKRVHLHVLKPPSHVHSVIPVRSTRIVPSHPTPLSPCVEKSDCAKDFRAVPRAHRWLGLGHVTNSRDHSSV